MRLFLAINPPAAIRQGVWDAAGPMRLAAPEVAWVVEPRIHLTMKFLGEQSEDAVPPLTEMLREVGMVHAAPVIRIGTVGAFPNFRRPRVVWIGVDPEPRLELLHHDVEVACARQGYELDGRPYRPHLSLGRVKEQGTVAVNRALHSAARKVRFTDEFFVSSIDLMQSTPGAGGSIYSVLATAPLRGS